jgi:hypothetical protein
MYCKHVTKRHRMYENRLDESWYARRNVVSGTVRDASYDVFNGVIVDCARYRPHVIIPLDVVIGR